MAKTSAIQKNLKRIKLAKRYEKKRAELKKIINNKKLGIIGEICSSIKIKQITKKFFKN